MKLIIAGSRTVDISTSTLLGVMEAFGIDLCSEEGHEVVSGGCPTGPDSIKVGDRLLQIIPQEQNWMEVIEVDELDETVRGSGGFGSSGS